MPKRKNPALPAAAWLIACGYIWHVWSREGNNIDKFDLNKGIDVWQAMPRNNPAELAAADEYFDTILMPLALTRFRAQHAEQQLPPYQGMILTMGTSWQPMALSIEALQPQQLWFICTEQTTAQLSKLTSFLKLDTGAYGYSVVGRADAAAIYEQMAAVYQQWQPQGRCCVDITGGTKAMASCAAMMAARLDMDIYYVESRYLPLYRRPLPGSERLERLPAPPLSV